MRPSSVAIVLFVLLCLASSMQAALSDGGMCNMKCNMRCFKAAVKDRCMKYCRLCCAECKCVPSGTYGNRDECPCYRDKKSRSGKPKCP